MRAVHSLVAFIATFLCAFAASAQTPVKIMPMGDSITSARKNPPLAYRDVATYRYHLYQQLVAANRCFDFVGSQTTISSVGAPQFNNFDKDHESYWGAKADVLAAGAQAWATAAQPDIVLLHAGSTDMFAGESAASTIDDIEDIIDNLRLGKEDVKIFLALVIPFGPGPYFTDITGLNALIPDLVTAKNAAKTGTMVDIELVDHHSGWNPAVHSAFDGVHPRGVGEELMATTWFNAIDSCVPVCASAPVADFSGTPTSGDAPLLVQFTDTSTNGPSSWLWNFGDGNTSTLQNPQHTYTTVGSFDVTLTATNGTGSDGETKSSYVVTSAPVLPVAAFSGTPLSGAINLPVNFTDESTGNPNSWLWDFGDGNTSTLQNPQHTYTTVGKFDVVLTATNGAGSDDETKVEYIETTVPAIAPTANFTATPTSGDAPLLVAFTDTSTQAPNQWHWHFGDGGTSDDQNPTHTYNNPGFYEVELTVWNAFGSDVEVKSSYIQVSDPGGPAAIKIMPLGDSITEARGVAVKYPIVIPAPQASYRYFLWHFLINDGMCVDFVGSLRGVRGQSVGDHDGVPKYGDFDQDHEGHWGFRADEIADNAKAWCDAAQPDIVVLHCGSNDIAAGEPAAQIHADVERIIDELRLSNPNIKIYLAQIIPFGPLFPANDVTAFNAGLPALVAGKSTINSPVILVDHATGWDNAKYSIDDVHPNERGEKRMAAVWHQAMRAQKEPICSPVTYKVMPMGDSITASRKGWASYRYWLWHQLKDNGYCVDFVGTSSGVRPPGPPKFDDFDQQYQGGWGLRADELAAGAYAAALAEEPDVVLLHAGIDDIYQGQDVPSTIADLGFLIDELRRARPCVTVMIAQVNPFGAPFTIDMGPLNAALPALVADKHEAQAPVILVDHFTGWDTTLFTFNGIHSNEAGEKRMANTWFEAIVDSNLPQCLPPTNFVNIMPLGDSLTAAANGRASYRYFLWHQLIASGHCPKFVGSKSGVRPPGTPKYSDFDQDYEGGWGLRADQIAANAKVWADAAQPDVVLLHAGIDDIYIGQDVPSTIAELGTIIDELRLSNPDVKIVIAKVNPFGAPFSIDVGPLNAEIPGLAAAKDTPASPVVVVDFETGWDTSLLTYNGIHPNEDGEIEMADRWHTAILGLNVKCVATLKDNGRGCAGSNGTPFLNSNDRPLIGSEFSVMIESVPANAPVVGMIGFSNSIWNGAKLPMDLTNFGMPGCVLFVSPDIMQPMTADDAGRLRWTLPAITDVVRAAGDNFYIQAFVSDPGANDRGITVTNGKMGTFGVR